jgi:hypothetical protein
VLDRNATKIVVQMLPGKITHDGKGETPSQSKDNKKIIKTQDFSQ